jgi:putative DNA methylase
MRVMRYIELDFPVERLNPVALAEGNSKKPIYQMHKWWARRLGSVFRMITLAAFAPPDVPEETLWGWFLAQADSLHHEGKIVLDPFMGGGTTVVEALRLGCRVVGVDINPVAWFVTKKEIEPVSLEDLDRAFRFLEETAGQKIRQYYWTTCPAGHSADVMYYFWVKVAECEACGATVRLWPNTELSLRDHCHVVVCPECLQVVETAGYDPRTTCPDCGAVFDPRRGNSGRGLFQCPVCGKRQRLVDAAARRGGPLPAQLHALEGFCPTCGRFFKRVDEADLALWEQARAEFERRRDDLLFPRQAIPTEGRSDPRPVNHGYTHFWHMFNERQLLCLSTLLEAILEIPDRNVRELMLLAFSDALDANNMFCKYETAWHKVSVFFGLHAYHPIERPTENNVWGTAFGRGTFVKCFEKVRRGKAYGQRPYERIDGARHSARGERAEGILVEDFAALQQTPRGTLLRCQSSEDLSFIPDRSVDAVITDPPYFDNVQYSELSDFFYVWLRLGLKDDYPWFDPPYSERPEEIVQNERRGKSADFFVDRLGRVFAECHRVLKDDGLLIFTFHHNQTWAWEGVARLLLRAGFYVSATPIVRSEGRSGFHSSAGNIRYDCILVCRKIQGAGSGSQDAGHGASAPDRPDRAAPSSLKASILADADRWVRRTLDTGLPVNPVDVFTVVMGKTVEFYTRAVAEGTIDAREDFLAELVEEMAGEAQATGKALAETAPCVRQLALF